jgi:hypothetical protein
MKECRNEGSKVQSSPQGRNSVSLLQHSRTCGKRSPRSSVSQSRSDGTLLTAGAAQRNPRTGRLSAPKSRRDDTYIHCKNRHIMRYVPLLYTLSFIRTCKSGIIRPINKVSSLRDLNGGKCPDVRIHGFRYAAPEVNKMLSLRDL